MEGDSWTRFQYTITRNLILSSTNDFSSTVRTLHSRVFDDLEIDSPDEERFKEEHETVHRGHEWVIDHESTIDEEKFHLGELLTTCEDEWTKLEELRWKHWKIMDLCNLLSKANDLTQQTFSAQLKMMYPRAYAGYGEPSFRSQHEITLEDMVQAQSNVLTRRHDYRNIIPRLSEEHELVSACKDWEDLKRELKRRGLVGRLPDGYMRPTVDNFHY
ncbi:hypothetical protein V865_000761 [Kwoniella europaea PYCC6329]|uniref:Uncharacterized protein n=1 Tax=Kwoniella europaea PYCC6329 TaxID=1423913 RepID=A0AAX4K8N2_9TREE